MRVTVKLFASYREKAGTSWFEVDLDQGAMVADLVAEVAERFTQLPAAERLVVAVNNEYQEHDFTLSDGDEAALIPPVSGG